ncbi:MAG: DUF1992 domain-containing protein [Desulfobacterales bacterium]|nr:DUF1992 domain-containing protein [Desulfobacterales bacterium]
MLVGFEKLVEQRIRDAQRKGEFKDLPGTGEPLDFSSDSHVPEDLRMAYKMLKNADCLPPEIEIKKQIHKTEDLLSGMRDSQEKYKAIKKLNYLIMKLNCLRSTSVDLEEPQYSGQIIERLSKS